MQINRYLTKSKLNEEIKMGCEGIELEKRTENEIKAKVILSSCENVTPKLNLTAFKKGLNI